MICIVQNRYRDVLEEGLKLADYRMTEFASSGGFLRKGSTTFLIGVAEEDVNQVHSLMKDICLRYEEKRGRPNPEHNRYISFMIDARDSLPFLKGQN
ncbi:cyclic-di-AMP receptor [Bacillus daqingensis]|uniref:Cyclic-di-AMP receptor n=1 Tax=Bacillus daqingensis TaxID=872396 RepID=A0ABV9NSL2_9BACI